MLGRSWGTRILQLAYIAFAVITVANYTANLAGTTRTQIPTEHSALTLVRSYLHSTTGLVLRQQL